MTQALATAAFLIVLWGAAKILLDLIADDGAMILAALRGQSMRAQPPRSAPSITIRYSKAKAPATRSLPLRLPLRDAA